MQQFVICNLYKNAKTDPNQSLFYSAAPQYGQRIRVTRMQRQPVIIKMKLMIKMALIIIMLIMIRILVIFLLIMIRKMQILMMKN